MRPWLLILPLLLFCLGLASGPVCSQWVPPEQMHRFTEMPLYDGISCGVTFPCCARCAPPHMLPQELDESDLVTAAQQMEQAKMVAPLQPQVAAEQ